MKKNSGLEGFKILLIILVLLILLGLTIPRILVFLASPKEEQTKQKAVKQLKEQTQEKAGKEKPCFDTSGYWNWQEGERKGKADISFSQDHKGATGNLLDASGERTIYSFMINSWNSKVGLGIPGEEVKVYGTGSISCNLVTLTLDKACSQSCEVDDPNSYGKYKIDFASSYLPKEINIIQ